MGSWFQVRGLYTANLRWLVDVRVYGTSKAQYRTYTTFADYVSIVTPPPIGERSIVMSVSVCLSLCVCLWVCLPAIIYGTTSPISTNFFVHVTYDRGSVLHRRRCGKLCISGLRMTLYLLISQGCSTSPPS